MPDWSLFFELLGVLADVCSVFAYIGAMALWVLEGADADKGRASAGDPERRFDVEPREGGAAEGPTNEEIR